jgi:DNA-binding transcriptional ArsR family regulator
MSLPAVVKHLSLLEESGFVVSQKIGRVRTCRIVPKRLDAAQVWLARQRATWEARFDRMDAFLLENGDMDE